VIGAAVIAAFLTWRSSSISPSGQIEVIDGDTVRFGAHQLREKVDQDCRLYVTWFAAGLRIIDIKDPANPKELGYFIPKPGDGGKAPLTNDVYQDDRGLLYVTDKERGMDVIEFTG